MSTRTKHLDDRLIDITECAKRLGRSVRWLRDRAHTFGFKLGKDWRFHWPSIVAKLEKRVGN